MELASGIAAFEAKEFSRAMQLLRPLAEQGDPRAQYRVAVMAQVGFGPCRLPIEKRGQAEIRSSGYRIRDHRQDWKGCGQSG